MCENKLPAAKLSAPNSLALGLLQSCRTYFKEEENAKRGKQLGVRHLKPISCPHSFEAC